MSDHAGIMGVMGAYDMKRLRRAGFITVWKLRERNRNFFKKAEDRVSQIVKKPLITVCRFCRNFT